MGTFKIEIVAIGGHGVDRGKKDGEVVDFKEGGETSPDALAKEFVEKLQAAGVYFGDPSAGATITHWPGDPSEVKDNLLTGVRSGNF
jgi:hypothetical protein